MEYTIDYITENNIDKTGYGFIYITTNNINGKMYIGQKIYNKNWKNYYGSGVHYKNAENFYGKKNFTRKIIDIANSKKDFNNLENYYIILYDAIISEMFYNIAQGGIGGNVIYNKTEEEKIEIWKKISNSHKGIMPTDEIKMKISESKKGTCVGKNNPNYGNHKLSGKNHPNYGKLGSDSSNAKSVICITTGEIFNCIKDAAKKYYTASSTITGCCRGRGKSAGKHPETGEKLIWKYYVNLEEEE